MNVEDWKKNTINGQIASKMVEIVKPRGEKVYMSNDFAHSIEYQGREFDVGLIVTGVEVGDYLAMFALSCCYKNGKGVEKDEDKGNVWLERALNTPGANPFSFIQVSNILNNPNSSDITYS